MAYFPTDQTDAPVTIEAATESPSSSIPPENKQDRDTPSLSPHQDGSRGEVEDKTVEEKKDEDSVNEGTSQVTPQQPTTDSGKIVRCSFDRYSTRHVVIAYTGINNLLCLP